MVSWPVRPRAGLLGEAADEVLVEKVDGLLVGLAELDVGPKEDGDEDNDENTDEEPEELEGVAEEDAEAEDEPLDCANPIKVLEYPSRMQNWESLPILLPSLSKTV